MFQDGKTAEDLAYGEQHEVIVSLLGKLKKVTRNHTHTHTHLSVSVTSETVLFDLNAGEGKEKT